MAARSWLGVALLLAVAAAAQGEGPGLSQLAAEARAKDAAKRIAAMEALLARGEGGRQALARVLEETAREQEGELARILADRSFAGAAGALGKELEECRREALAFILDPDAFGKGTGIVEMERRVNRIRPLWEAPELFVAERLKSLAASLERLGEVARYGGALALPGPAAAADRAVAAVRARIAVDKMGVSPAQVRWNDEVLAWNEGECPTSADVEELEVVRLANRYRVMMGFRALELDERILRAARAHSQEMEDLGYFSHTSPVADHADFGARLRIQGYGGGLGENIATALDAKRAFHGWYLSAGHHRNMLLAQATAIAVGRSRGREGLHQWTMNLGAGDSLRGRTLTDRSLLYLQRRRQVPAGDAQALLELARWCAANGLIREMCDACRDALRLDPSLEEPRQLLARRFELEGRKR